VKHELPPKSTLRQELVLCGKPKCAKLHGPYWYGYFRGDGREGRGGRLRKVYIGKKLPAEIVRRRMKEKRRQRGSEHDPRVLRELQLDWTDGDDEA
jgi:hypothetical protein